MSDGVAQSFEEKLDRIDAIVRELETGRTGLDRAVQLFKEGKKLARECEQMLKDAQTQIDGAAAEPAQNAPSDEIPF
jgi:exodeoxyribonuclease VII small subunit